MLLSFLAYNELRRDTYLAMPDKQVEHGLFRTKQAERSTGEGTAERFEKFAGVTIPLDVSFPPGG